MGRFGIPKLRRLFTANCETIRNSCLFGNSSMSRQTKELALSGSRSISESIDQSVNQSIQSGQSLSGSVSRSFSQSINQSNPDTQSDRSVSGFRQPDLCDGRTAAEARTGHVNIWEAVTTQ